MCGIFKMRFEIYVLGFSCNNKQKNIYYDIESGNLLNHPSKDEIYSREVQINYGHLEQLMAFQDGRQIYHPRWSNDDSKIIFDTAVEYGRNLGCYDIEEKKFEIYLVWTNDEST